MTDQLRKRMMKKRRVKTLAFAVTSDICIEVNTYALTRPTTPGMIVRCDRFCFLQLQLWLQGYHVKILCAVTAAAVKICYNQSHLFYVFFC
jgi:hypothetical protein